MRLRPLLLAAILVGAAAVPAAADLPPACVATPTSPVCSFKCVAAASATLTVAGPSFVAGSISCGTGVVSCFGAVTCSASVLGGDGTGTCRLEQGTVAICSPG